MENPSQYLDILIRELAKLPGIGTKSASRLAFHILKEPSSEVERLIGAMVSLKENIQTCTVCGGIADNEVCSICADTERDEYSLCVVENAKDMLTIEATGEFQGRYHVLMGILSPLDGVGPEDLNIAPLIERCGRESVSEIILALNPTVEGDATCLYLAKILKPSGITVTRIAHGLPVGSDLEFVDTATIVKSFEGRSRM